MHVNKFSYLSSSLTWLALRNELSRCCLVTSIRKSSSSSTFTVSSIRQSFNKVPNHQCFPNINSSSYSHFSRYSASTIMRPHSKEFSFDDYDVIGFDLDGTVLRYKLDEMVPLEYEVLSRFLVDKKGYSKNLLLGLNKIADKDFLQKGLFLDADRGNILKLSSDGSIIKACHGTKLMSEDEIIAIYGEEKEWSVTTQFIKDPLSAWNGPLAEKIRSLLDYFDISVSLIFARIIDEIDVDRNLKGNQSDPYTVWPDILEALINMYTREHFNNGKSMYFESLKKEPNRFILKTSPTVIDWLKNLKAKNKKLFLLTGSHIDFANCTASYALNKDWRDLFDVVICFAKKPGFFYASRPFHKIEGFNEMEDPIAHDSQLQLNSVYSMGNWEQLLKSFANEMGKDTSEIKSLYVGDNLVQDVYAPDALAKIDSVALSEEMLAENCANNEYNPEKFEFKDIVASRHWNSYFFDDGTPTLWTSVIGKHSKMCIPTLDYVAGKPIDFKYCMDNEIGFYPSSPIVN